MTVKYMYEKSHTPPGWNMIGWLKITSPVHVSVIVHLRIKLCKYTFFLLNIKYVQQYPLPYLVNKYGRVWSFWPNSLGEKFPYFMSNIHPCTCEQQECH